VTAKGTPGQRASIGQRALYHFVRWVVVGFCRAFWAMTVDGTEHVPRTGPFILSPVHRSNIDTPVVGAVTRRRLRYMGKDTMWKYRWSAWFFTTMGGFPVHRGAADREALRRCMEVIDAGEPLVMFPEGTRQSGPVVEHLHDGPAFVAARTGAPIVPVGIGGSEPAMPKGARMIRPVRLHLEIGEPIWPQPREPGGRVPRRVVRELTDDLRDELQRLFDLAQEKVARPNPPRP
jgi:1-acyl-sn-glycerol-3-phosphate acyltransferase